MRMGIVGKAGFNQEIPPILFRQVHCVPEKDNVSITVLQGGVAYSFKFLRRCLFEEWEVVSAFLRKDSFREIPLIRCEQQIQSAPCFGAQWRRFHFIRWFRY